MIKIDLDKAKVIAHDKRREARTQELTPLDIQSTIPSLAEQAEAQRQVIREKYALIQINIDEALTETQIKQAIAEIL